MLNSHVVSLYSSFICTLALPLRYLIRSDPLAHVPEEPPVRSSSLKEGHESSIDAREDTQLWCQAVSGGSHLHNHPLQLSWGSGCVHADPVWKRILNCAPAVCNCITWVPTVWQMTCPEMCLLWPFNHLATDNVSKDSVIVCESALRESDIDKFVNLLEGILIRSITSAMLPSVKQIHQAQELGSQEHSGDVHCHWKCFLFLGCVSFRKIASWTSWSDILARRGLCPRIYTSVLDLLRL